MYPAIEPVGQARDDYDIFASLGQLMGVEEAFTEGRTSEDWQRWLYEVSQQRLSKSGVELPAYTSFREAGWHKLPLPDKQNIMFADFRRDPDQYPLKTPQERLRSSQAQLLALPMMIVWAIRLGLPHRNGWARRKILILYICSRTSPEQNCTASLIRVPLRQLQKLRDAKKYRCIKMMLLPEG